MAELRRYTDILAVLDTLMHKRITLVNTSKWIDQNDRATLELYAARAGYDNIAAYCLTEAGETFHHWQIFAGHGFGACIVFDKAKFLDRMKARHLLCGPMEYLAASRLAENGSIENPRLPFLKREVFQDEREYRVISGLDDLIDGDTLSVGIDLSMIERVVFSSAIPRPLLETVIEIVREFDGCANMALRYSRLTNNVIWQANLSKAVKSGKRPKTKSL